jgi:hypothetical protein
MPVSSSKTQHAQCHPGPTIQYHFLYFWPILPFGLFAIVWRHCYFNTFLNFRLILARRGMLMYFLPHLPIHTSLPPLDTTFQRLDLFRHSQFNRTLAVHLLPLLVDLQSPYPSGILSLSISQHCRRILYFISRWSRPSILNLFSFVSASQVHLNITTNEYQRNVTSTYCTSILDLRFNYCLPLPWPVTQPTSSHHYGCRFSTTVPHWRTIICLRRASLFKSMGCSSISLFSTLCCFTSALHCS